MPRSEPDRDRVRTLGEFIRAQRNLARLSLRDMAAMTGVSNPYLSQLERGLHEPSVRVISAIARALDLPPETLLAHAGLGGDEPGDASAHRSEGGVRAPDTEEAIRADPHLSDAQKDALVAVYRSYRAGTA